ncbi:VPLPA-CTERM sorting domain-containing protein [Roseibium aggregatum]|uniref:VPLPA-CTERM sorting domain-containing protein n=1 Tax=Roseibium aggregatum TaxID=187304 RepID=A0A939J344_9HYPH|nr:VPLPA-CTERM sorting domain-containing protein [Roseibium aggregatum]MBN9669765.1 VPLPA-CTERM sorting domain-containing protein [Roseibium aggregatum]
MALFRYKLLSVALLSGLQLTTNASAMTASYTNSYTNVGSTASYASSFSDSFDFSNLVASAAADGNSLTILSASLSISGYSVEDASTSSSSYSTCSGTFSYGVCWGDTGRVTKNYIGDRTSDRAIFSGDGWSVSTNTTYTPSTQSTTTSGNDTTINYYYNYFGDVSASGIASDTVLANLSDGVLDYVVYLYGDSFSTLSITLDLEYETAPMAVPVPESLPLALTGLAVLGLGMRRRRSRHTSA